MAMVPHRIEEALTADDRIDAVKDFKVERCADRHALHIQFTIVTADVEIPAETEVEI